MGVTIGIFIILKVSFDVFGIIIKLDRTSWLILQHRSHPTRDIYQGEKRYCYNRLKFEICTG